MMSDKEYNQILEMLDEATKNLMKFQKEYGDHITLENQARFNVVMGQYSFAVDLWREAVKQF